MRLVGGNLSQLVNRTEKAPREAGFLFWSHQGVRFYRCLSVLGRPVVDALRREGLNPVPVSITAGRRGNARTRFARLGVESAGSLLKTTKADAKTAI